MTFERLKLDLICFISSLLKVDVHISYKKPTNVLQIDLT